MPPRPPGNILQPSYGEMNFWRRTHHPYQLPSRELGSEILATLRSRRGGIYYIKSNSFKQVHYLDEYCIYVCNFVPLNLMPIDRLNTELGSGLIRKEALDLLAYSYTRSETGNFLIKDDLGLVSERYIVNALISLTNSLAKGEIEELVRLSYQALERNIEERSRTVIHQRGLGVAISAMNREMQYEHFIPPRPPRPGDGNLNSHEYSALPYLHTPEDSFTSRRANPIIIPPPGEVGGQEQDTTKSARSEVRFTLPRMQPVFGTAKEAQINSAKTNVTVSKTDDELHSLRQRLERARKRKEEAEKAKDLHTAFDLTTYAIPELEAKLEKVLEQRKAQEKLTAPVSQNQEDWRPGVEMISEDEDDEGESEAEAEDE